MKRVLYACFALLPLFMMISCNKTTTPTTPNDSTIFQASAKKPAPTPTTTPTPGGETSICVASGDPGTSGIIITNSSALQSLGSGVGGQWLGSDASGDCQSLGPQASCPSLSIDSTATLNIPMDNTIISGNINIVGGCAIAFTVNGHSVVNSSGAGQVNQDITSFLVKGTNTISIMTSFGTTSSGGPCICNPGFGTITECFGLDYKICTNVIQPTPNPSQTPNPSPSGTMTPPTITPTGTLTPTISPTLTVTGTQTVSPSVTVSETITETVSPTTSITDTPTATVTDTQTSNATDTPTSTPTVTDTPTASPTATPGCVAGNYSQPVTRYAQQDPTWANTELDHSTDPVETIGHRGCFLTSMGMIAGDDPATTNQIFTNSTPAGVISTGDLDSTAGADDLGYTAIDPATYSDSDLEMLMQNNTTERFIVQVQHGAHNHFVVVTGEVFDPSTGHCRFTISDPGPSNFQYLDQYGEDNLQNIRGFVPDN